MIRERNEGFGFLEADGDHGHMLRRRWLAVAVIAAVALAGAVLSEMSVARHDADRPAPPGPFGQMPF
ncbi:hypothetical protein ASE17_11330 [Phenylobacterium sp. Root77]|jgi:hypothetical protein|uniref:hypothetical protein n=1 Tax=unclassified Phenylobacterium TaxID=2640670 RepID=UPI0006FA5CE8|nr:MULTISPECIES: hypothetical protein [unclassified Phenylobacterium]KQW73496.1 hypothetical protein ASC73_03895 [Phenylobacterium sp. Root1277]KQW92715.1 hypothetical protein ASC79_14605 [Phenylobacterium sp. Root1290]KRC40943.1 hypothetical protein ASE17_11330 [Phenylobacterium sp. Root77]